MKSPCIRVCKLDINWVCTGCGRTSVEISNWMRYSNEERQAIIDRCNQYKIEDASNERKRDPSNRDAN